MIFYGQELLLITLVCVTDYNLGLRVKDLICARLRPICEIDLREDIVSKDRTHESYEVLWRIVAHKTNSGSLRHLKMNKSLSKLHSSIVVHLPAYRDSGGFTFTGEGELPHAFELPHMRHLAEESLAYCDRCLRAWQPLRCLV